YGAQEMITAAARRLAEEVAAGARRPAEITSDALELALTDGVPPVDLMIRTAGEQRLSDFLLWEAAYAELLFTPTLWPDFRQADLATAVAEYRRRERKFGGLVVVGGNLGSAVSPKVAVG
ncbi:MAG TPA: undecaprenyl diphosphate synthase family protein, partial [Gemmatimonadales bacterium]